MCMSSDSNMIYHKFSHGTVPYTLNGENVYVMLEWKLTVCCGLVLSCKFYLLRITSFQVVPCTAFQLSVFGIHNRVYCDVAVIQWITFVS